MEKTADPNRTAASDQASPTGLTAAEVQERIRRGQTNAFEARVGRTYGQIIRDNLFNLFNIVLGSLLIIVIASGDYTTAFFAGFSVVTNSFLGMIQEINAKRKLDKMATLSQQRVAVYRDGALASVPMHDVVIDDVIKIEPGDRLVVGGTVLRSDSMEIDESLLTGESDAIFKEADDEVYSGSFCIAGAGTMRATRVGKDSNINKLSVIAKQYKQVKTPTQEKIDALVELSVLIMFILGPMLFIRGFIDQHEFLPIVKNAVVFVTSLVPQGLVLVAILSLTIGAIRISRHQTLIQRVNAVESLANATVLCFDKTGTLTRNELAVTEVITLGEFGEEQVREKLRHYINNLAHLNRTAGAVAAYANDGADAPYPRKEREIPFTSTRKWGAVVLPDETLIMGAPERILPPHEDDPVARHAHDLSVQGMRVLAFARIDTPPDDGALDGKAEPIALIVMSDRVREDIQETLQAFRDENIGLKVISGDNVETVRAIASQAGMDVTEAYTGSQLDAMEDAQLEAAVTRANLFARIEPETKRRIVGALQNKGAYVAMVGDGVNDVPALKAANLAIVMNDGTQISKDVADIVLLNNAMSTLPLAFREGRDITQTVFGTMKMFLVRNMYNVLLFVFIFFMAMPFPITPIQISWAAFGTVNMPATLIAFGFLRPQYMQRFRRDVVDYIFSGGLVGAVLIALVYVVVYFYSNRDVKVTRSAVTVFVCLFGMLIVWNVQGVEIYDPRSFIRHWRVVVLTALLTALTILAMYVLPGLFEFKPFSASADMLVIVFITFAFLLAMVLVSHAMKYRYLLNRLWMLFAP